VAPFGWGGGAEGPNAGKDGTDVCSTVYVLRVTEDVRLVVDVCDVSTSEWVLGVEEHIPGFVSSRNTVPVLFGI